MGHRNARYNKLVNALKRRAILIKKKNLVLLQNDDKRGHVLGQRLHHVGVRLRARFRLGPPYCQLEDVAASGQSCGELSAAASNVTNFGHQRDRSRYQTLGPHQEEAELRLRHGPECKYNNDYFAQCLAAKFSRFNLHVETL